jgi:D-tyrosyl-tRNA(Tyr) deacylase
VSRASVTVEDRLVGEVQQGVLALIGVSAGDDAQRAERLAERILALRLFADDAGRMNLSVRDVGGGVLLVPQFTLAADTRKGSRPGFSTAAAPELARTLFDHLVTRVREQLAQVATGEFGAHMRVALVNEGPVTFWLEA